MSDDTKKPAGDKAAKPKRKHVKTGRPRGFEKIFKVINKDIVRKAYIAWDWETQEDLAKQIMEKYGETVSTQYISKHALKDGWEDIRTTNLAGAGPRYLPNIQALKRDAINFDELEALKGFKARLVKRISAEISNHPSPEFFKGMMDVYHSVHEAITNTWEYKLRQQNDNAPTPPGSPPPKPTVEEGAPKQLTAQIAPFHLGARFFRHPFI